MAGPKEYYTKRCPACGAENVSDIEKLTAPGWGVAGLGLAIILGSGAALAWISLPIPVMIMFVASGAGLVGYARRQLVYQSNRCTGCGREGTFPMVKVELPDAKKQRD